MRLRGFKLLAYFFVILIISLGITNTLIFYEIKRLTEETLYEQAYAHYMAYLLSNRSYRGDKNFNISETQPEKSLSYVFKDPSHPDKYVYVNVKLTYAEKFFQEPLKRILLFEFVAVFLVFFVYQLVVEDFINKMKQQEEWVKSLVASIAHKFGNFLSVQKLNLALLKTRIRDQDILSRLERSLSKVEKDMNLILNVLREEKHMRREWIRADSLILKTLEYLKEEASEKKVILKLSEAYIYADETDLGDIFYNIISNGLRYSKSFFHIRLCKGQKSVSFIFRNDISNWEARGMGIGIILLERVVRRQRGTLSIRIKKHYTVLLKLRGR